MADILLNCSFLGRNVGRLLPIQTSPNETVGELKNAIKEKKKPLDHIAAYRLDIWMVREPPLQRIHHW
jgi:hypothetical protein